jgi:predicted permease
MAWLRKLFATIRPSRLETHLDDELRFHLEQRTDDFIAQGMTPEQARLEAARLFGNRTLLTESARDRDVLMWLQTTIADLRYALRMLRRNPGFAAAAVLSLALGIGANTAIFSLLDQVLLRGLPVSHPEDLVFLSWQGPNQAVDIGSHTMSYPMYRDLRDQNQMFTGVLARFHLDFSVAYGDRTERVDGELVSGNYFEVLGVGAALGRTFTAQDDTTPGGHPVAMLSYDYWTARFHSDPGILGQKVVVDGLPLTIVGVSQKGFDGVELGYSPRVRVPLAMKARMTQGYFAEFFTLENRRAFWLHSYARLKPGWTRQQANAALRPLFHSLLESEVRGGFQDVSAQDRAAYLRASLDVQPGGQGRSPLRNDYDTPLRMLMAIVGLVLLIASANVASLLLARAAARQRELATRLAIGASAGRIARQALAESVLLAFAGGVAGLFLAIWIEQALLSFIPVPSASLHLTTAPDWRVLSFTLAVCLMTGLLFGLAPAMAAMRVDLAPTLKVDARHVAGGPARFRQALVVLQVSLSALLLIGASQFLRSLVNLHRIDTGLRTASVFTFSVNPSLNGYNKERSVRFYRALRDRLSAVPGVESVGAAAIPVLAEDWWANAVTLDGAEPAPRDQAHPNFNMVSPGYLTALGIPLLAGRNFTPADADSKVRVAMVNQTFVQKFCAGRNPVGRRIGMGDDPGTKVDIEIVGLMRDANYQTVREEVRPQVFLDDEQNPDIQQVNFYVKTAFDFLPMSATVRQLVRGLDPAVPVSDLRTMDAQAELTLARDRMMTVLTSAFGGVATLLAAFGLYGLMSFNVARRTREIAVRMALGAEAGSVIWLVMKEVLALVIGGACLAIPAARALTALVRSQLYGVAPDDVASIVAATASLALVALVAAYIPLRRAARIDPMRVLRSE